MKWNATRYKNRLDNVLSIPLNANNMRFGEIQIRSNNGSYRAIVTDGYDYISIERYFDSISELIRYLKRALSNNQ